ncbi:type IV conjugative transfer system pilin TraA [Serratia fonticola]|uniref:type IV conjugative transfer system pilin TraA n=1 Tax=Serratia fonticola TaxID=47917 RepID=UPI001378E795|nr:type IV conjugative transfer system pilin TraA [Serratia fonticola]NCG53643.1 type IV conjugative transfer system pilin TraA [Serratia fonticola]
MITALSAQGNSITPSKGKSLFRKLFCRTSVIKALKTILPFAVLAAFFPQLALAAGSGTDLLQSGDADVKATIGSNSVAMKWLIAIEVVVGTVLYIATKNLKYLSGFIVVSILLAVGFRVAGF